MEAANTIRRALVVTLSGLEEALKKVRAQH
jgi:hypothetical protein